MKMHLLQNVSANEDDFFFKIIIAYFPSFAVLKHKYIYLKETSFHS